MMIAFELRGCCTVPDGTTAVPGLANHVRLPSGALISVQAVIEWSSGPDADDHQDLSYADASALGLIVELESREVVALGPEDRI